MVAAIDLGLIYGLMALGVYLTFRVLDFADMTVDGAFTTGGALAAMLILRGGDPLAATIAAFGGGLVAGTVTALLNTKGGINPLLAGILTQISLYSINLRIMGKANLPLLRTDTLLSGMRNDGLFATPTSVLVFALVVAAFAAALVWFLTTDTGLAIQATGDNQGMARAQGINTDAMKILGVALANGLVALSGALMAQYQGYADIGMGIGQIVAGLASVIIGQAIFGNRPVWRSVVAVVLGSVIYRMVIQLALMVGFNPNDMKLISAALVVAALLLPKAGAFRGLRDRTRARSLTPDKPALEVADA